MIGKFELRDLKAIPLKDGEKEGRSNFSFTKTDDLKLAEEIVSNVLGEKWLKGAWPNCYYLPDQKIWRGKTDFIYYPPKNAYKICINITHPSHAEHRNTYHGTTTDRILSILENGLQLSGTGNATAQNPCGTRHQGRIFSSPQWDTALSYAKVCEVKSRKYKVVFKCLQDPHSMVALEDPVHSGETADGDYFYTTDPSSIVVFAVLIHFLN